MPPKQDEELAVWQVACANLDKAHMKHLVHHVILRVPGLLETPCSMMFHLLTVWLISHTPGVPLTINGLHSVNGAGYTHALPPPPTENLLLPGSAPARDLLAIWPTP